MISNAEIKILSELKERAGRKTQQKYLIEGKRAVAEALAGKANIIRIITNLAASSDKFAEILSIAEERGINVEEIPTAKFDRLSTTEASQGIIAIADTSERGIDGLISELRSKRKAIVVALDRISDPGNLGAILRSAAWFGADAVLLARGSVDVYNPKVVRSAMGVIGELTVVQDVVLATELSRLKSFGFEAVACMQDGKVSYSDFVFPQKMVAVFGSEAVGITKTVITECAETVFIPRVGKMESLNVSIASSIVLSEIARQQSKGGRDS